MYVGSVEAKELPFAPLKLVVSKFQDAFGMIKLIGSWLCDAVFDVVLCSEAFLMFLITMINVLLKHFFIQDFFLWMFITFMAMVMFFSIID